MSGFALDGWGLVGALLAVAGLALLLGAAFGYFTAATDLRAEKTRAWDVGYRRATADAADTSSTVVVRSINPYPQIGARRHPFEPAPVPPHFDFRAEWVGTPLHPESRRVPGLFDQDAPVATSTELRSD